MNEPSKKKQREVTFIFRDRRNKDAAHGIRQMKAGHWKSKKEIEPKQVSTVTIDNINPPSLCISLERRKREKEGEEGK